MLCVKYERVGYIRSVQTATSSILIQYKAWWKLSRKIRTGSFVRATGWGPDSCNVFSISTGHL